MESQPASSPSANATLVGNAFVSQYYNILHLSPHNVHRFYTDQSKLSRAEVGINADIVEAQDKIQEKIMSMNFDGLQAQIKTVDSLASLNGSVLVMVTGALSSRIGWHRNFVQTFFLAPQEKGYFVLSDICRFLDGEGDPLPEVRPMTPVVEQEVFPLSQQDDSGYSASQETEKDSDADNGVVVEERDFTTQTAAVVGEMDSIAPSPGPGPGTAPASAPSPAPAPPEAVPEEVEEPTPSVKAENKEGAPKLSYASILREASAAPSVASRPAGPRRAISSQAAADSPLPASQVPSQEFATQNSGGITNVVQNGLSDGGDGNSVYVKNLPLSIRQEELEKEFEKFGSVKPGGVNLRNQKQGVCFAFIEFEDVTSVRSAIEASPILIGGRQVYVEEKKPTLTGSLGARGRFGQGRGYQGDGMIGRGNLGGRNFRRGAYSSERDFGARGRGGRWIGNRRGDVQVGNGSRQQTNRFSSD